MPEGPEIKITVETIRPLLVNKKVNSAFCMSGRYNNKYPEGYEDFFQTLLTSTVKIQEINCKGKFIYWKFDNDWVLMNTMGMSGQWSPKQGKHPCFGFTLGENVDSYEYIYFNDPRHFGTIKFVSSEKELKEKLNEFGWDPLHQDGLTVPWLNWLKSELSRSSKPIGQILLDQSLFAGVGNYIRAEALYQAEMSPWRLGKSLSKEDLEKLCLAIVSVMEESYKYQGATLLTYKDAYGNEGRYSSCFKVYGKEVDPLGNTIKKEATPEGRTIHWCPTIQT